MLKIAVRVDSASFIGIGHVMRCLTLVNAITAEHPACVYFFCRDFAGNINQQVEAHGHQLVLMAKSNHDVTGTLAHSHWLGAHINEDVHEFKRLATNVLSNTSNSTSTPQHFDYLIVDHYGIDISWHQQARDITDKLIVIDDLADRVHDCDFIIDQTYNCLENKYDDLVPSHCKRLLGTKYAMLRPEFNPELEFGLSPSQLCQLRVEQFNSNLLVMFGGTDTDNLSQQTLVALEKQPTINRVDIIVGSSAVHKQQLSDYCALHSKFRLHIAPTNIAELMLNADIAIGAAGTTSWERCALALPSIVVIQADNQKDIAKSLADDKISMVYDKAELAQALKEGLSNLLAESELRQQMSKKSLMACDGLGSSRLVNVILR